MGGFPSRRNANVEEVDITTTNAYRYPPKSGCYFGSHFIMGGEKFETTQPEAYLFGENTDLNFLGGRPTPFPYPAPQAHEPTKTLKSLVNIRKDSLRFIKATDNMSPKKVDSEDQEEDPCTKYNIEFTFDTDVRVAVTIYYFATEEITNGQAIYHPRDPCMNSETYHYKRGANQTFSQTTHIIDPSKFGEEEWQFNPDKEVIPVVVQCVVEDELHTGHSHALFGFVEKFSNGGYVLKPLKQKQVVDGLSYLLQEIYGIENKSRERVKLDDDLDDNGSECVICMCETRDTLILPCRHLCLCNMCADNLRYQANNCPICRAPFRALLQIRALRKKLSIVQSPQNDSSEENSFSQEGVPTGYEAVSLLEALNGPDVPPTSPASQPTQPNVPMGLPPDDDSSPVLKRKGRRSSGRSSNRRNQKAHKPDRVQPSQEDIAETPVSPEIVMTAHITEPVKDGCSVKCPIDRDDLQQQAENLVDTAAATVATRPELISNKENNLLTDNKSPTESQIAQDTSDIKLGTEIDLDDNTVIEIAEETENNPAIPLPSKYEQIKAEETADEPLLEGSASDNSSQQTLELSESDNTASVMCESFEEPEIIVTDNDDVINPPQLCLLQELSLDRGAGVPLAPTSTAEEQVDGSGGSSYSSTSSAKGLLDGDVVVMTDIDIEQ